MNKHGTDMWLKNYAKKILVSDKELNDVNSERLKMALIYRTLTQWIMIIICISLPIQW